MRSAARPASLLKERILIPGRLRRPHRRRCCCRCRSAVIRDVCVAEPGDISGVHMSYQGLVLRAESVVVGLEPIVRGDHGNEQIAEPHVSRFRGEPVRAWIALPKSGWVIMVSSSL
jgi:hypothetical protein